ncbi:MAG: hypothetical protein PHE61_02275 [Candidatus Omnitrophica bacterium]|nr:hypothetical protein [Candidatus Omnitrophota bacterium]
MNKVMDIVILFCAVWIVLARLVPALGQVRFAAVAAAVIIVLEIVKLVQKKA